MTDLTPEELCPCPDCGAPADCECKLGMLHGQEDAINDERGIVWRETSAPWCFTHNCEVEA